MPGEQEPAYERAEALETIAAEIEAIANRIGGRRPNLSPDEAAAKHLLLAASKACRIVDPHTAGRPQEQYVRATREQIEAALQTLQSPRSSYPINH
jgi:hypothetical protein